jgi:intracellular sulfur oxidation DsrE/DsrF family protein
MKSISTLTRRGALHTIGAISLTAALASQADAEPSLAGHGELLELDYALATLPRRRDFRTVPFLLNDKRFWDHEAANALLAYAAPRQMWEASELASPWLSLMRESVNSQIVSFGHKDFLAIAAVRGGAHLALFTQAAWDKYKLATKTDGKYTSNTFIIEKPGVSPTDDIQNVDGFYGPNNSNIITLQRRGMVFVACHDSIHAISRGLRGSPGFSSLSTDEIAADLTNSLLPGVVLVPSVVAFIAELQRAGYSYAKAG